MPTITIVDESTRGEQTTWNLDLLEETLSLRELIRRRIYQEVTEYNARQSGFFQGLVQPTDAADWRLPHRSEDDPLPLEQIPPLVFSEVLRDIDLFVGVASVGNDPTWLDGGHDDRYHAYWHSYSFGDLSATAETRKYLLSRLVPRLTIASRCAIEGRFLRVRGDLRTYKIHLGSGNILMEPNDQYLCIVPGRSSGTTETEHLFLPFEGDTVLSIILSKAFLLAEDTRITDPSITRQIAQR